ncbi:hypothetical protein QL285_069344 [Trifolium repens]|nr:hypothetical protein QL285_069344 [Trifolium repens]
MTESLTILRSTSPEIATEPLSPDRTLNTMTTSFRDKVLRGAKVPTRHEKVDLIAQKLVTVEHVQGNKLLPMLHVEKNFIDELSIPWKDALVVKLINGDKLELNIMKKKLESVWNLAGKFDLKEIGDGFFMVKFNNEEGKANVIDGVPWKIDDCYLLVRQWTSDFNTEKEVFKTMVWARILSLNFVYYDESFLWTLASAIGHPVKVDLDTLRVEYGRFARVCVDIDIRYTVAGKIGINGEWYEVEYEETTIMSS